MVVWPEGNAWVEDIICGNMVSGLGLAMATFKKYTTALPAIKEYPRLMN